MKKKITSDSRRSTALKRVAEVGTGTATALLGLKAATALVQGTTGLSGGAAVVKTVSLVGGGSLGVGLCVILGAAAVGTVAATAVLDNAKEVGDAR